MQRFSPTEPLNHSDVLLLSMQGAVGDMLCHFIDKDGNVIQSSLERQTDEHTIWSS